MKIGMFRRTASTEMSILRDGLEIKSLKDGSAAQMKFLLSSTPFCTQRPSKEINTRTTILTMEGEIIIIWVSTTEAMIMMKNSKKWQTQTKWMKIRIKSE